MSLIPFPNVPKLPGVPTLLREVISSVLPAEITLLVADAKLIAGFFAPSQWGIHNAKGEPIAIVDSFVSMDHDKEWRISNYPIEGGSFAAYNKVETPYQQRIVLSRGGTADERGDFISAVSKAVSSLELYSIETPEILFYNVSLTSFRFGRRSNKGATIIVMEITVEQIRTVDPPTYSNTASPAGAAQVNGGTVQAQVPTADEAAAGSSGAD